MFNQVDLAFFISNESSAYCNDRWRQKIASEGDCEKNALPLRFTVGCIVFSMDFFRQFHTMVTIFGS